MSYSPIVSTPDLIRPDYVIYDYNNGIFKIVRHKGDKWFGIPFSDRQKKDNIEKLDSSLSRSRRVVLELALCNDWSYFCTFTLDGSKHDRFDLDNWHKVFCQWLRDQRKKFPDLDLRYLLVPEQHKDGAWHMHGFFSDITSVLTSFSDLLKAGQNVPQRLVDNNYFTWSALSSKFGFCSFAPVLNKVAAGFYVTKYLSKSIGDSGVNVGKHLYYCSRFLNRAVKHGDIYGNCNYLDSFLTNHYEFCDTGMTHVKDGLSWDFALEFMNIESLDLHVEADSETVLSVDTFSEITQEIILGF